MRSFLEPRSVVLVGVSRRSGSGAYNGLEMMRRYGYEGPLWVVHPEADRILGHEVHRSVRDLPESPELAVISVGRDNVPGVFRDCVARGIRRVIVVSQGFADADERGRAMQQELAELARESGTRVLGPNTMGVLNAFNGFSTAMLDLPRPADPPPLGLVAQSGVFQVGPEAFTGPLGKAIDVGNTCDVDPVEALEYFAEDDQVRVIALYLEGITRGGDLLETLSRITSRKPVIALKAGRSAAGAEAALSHTGSLVGEDAVIDAALARAGVVRVPNVMALRAACRSFLAFDPMRGPNVAVATCSGAVGIMSADACDDYGLELSPFPDALRREVTPPRMSWHRLINPADIWPLALGSGDYPELTRRTILGLLRDERVQGVVGILVCMDSPLHQDHALEKLAREIAANNAERKPVALWLYGDGAARHAESINAAWLPGVACFNSLDEAMMGLAATWRHRMLARRRDERTVEPARAVAAGRPALERDTLLVGAEAERLLAGYGLAFAPGGRTGDVDAALALADQVGYPVVLKIDSPDWLHKSDRGGVLLDVRSAEDLRAGFAELLGRFAEETPEGKLDGIQVQRQMTGVELLLGIHRDPEFGPVVVVGQGGIYTEVFRDVAREPAPLTRADAGRMIDGLRIAPLLRGVRGQPAVDRDALLDALLALSDVAVAHPEITELDLNPVLASPAGCHGVDARIVT
jgi:acetyltransferase